MEPPKQDFSETVEKVDSDEKLLAVIKRHPFGIIKMYVTVVVGLVFAGLLLAMILPGIIPREENEAIYSVIAILAVTIMGLMAFILFVATIIYFRSKIVLTDKTITQTLQNGLFNRKISQLAVTNIEDVTAQKNGFFPTMFNYGRLMIETAGEQINFHFDYCPNPDHYAKLILDSRQQYIGQFDTTMQQNGRNFAAFQQQQYIAQNQMMNQSQPTQFNQAPNQQPQPQYPNPGNPVVSSAPDQTQSAPQQSPQSSSQQAAAPMSTTPGTDSPEQT
ncbi:MAG: hypothetical protein QG628_382 [Patescibacteria group bacterium]|nr:hypothetical protein [Patescibacteria group bacterium]